MTTEFTNGTAKLKILCLHGYRTSGKILLMQTAALVYHCNIQCSFVDAPFEASGPPDSLVAKVYPNEHYYQWFGINSNNKGEELEQSILKIKKYITDHGPFDGILGFSQGASMVARLIVSVAANDANLNIKFAILVGGVAPTDYIILVCFILIMLRCAHHHHFLPQDKKIAIPSLHVMGRADPLLAQSRALVQLFDEDSRTLMEHEEGHNIPSLRSGLYPGITQWIEAHR